MSWINKLTRFNYIFFKIFPYLVPPRLAKISFPSETLAGMRAQSTCFIQEGDQPIEISWLKNGQSFDEGSGLRTSRLDDFTSILVIEKAAAHDSANYTCVATNSARMTTSSAELSVSGEL